jgi:AcrR family transcriptional regulator
LDAAESLFADRGFDGVSIRQIADEAGVTLGVVGFHGRSKLELFHTVISRRAAVLSTARRKSLAELRAGSMRGVRLRDLMTAYIMPYVEIASSGDPQWRAYARLIGRTVYDDRWYPILLYNSDAAEYIEAIQAVMPNANKEWLAAVFVMAVASMLSTVNSTARMKVLAGNPSKNALAQYADILVRFCTAGIESAATAADPSKSHLLATEPRSSGSDITSRTRRANR